MYYANEHIPTTIHHLPTPDPVLPPLTSGAAVVVTHYKFGRHDRVATTRVISSNPDAPTGRYQHQY